MVIGATGSIGSVCSRLLAQAIHNVILVAPRPEKLIALKRQIEGETPEANITIATSPDDYLGEAAKANSRTPFAHPEGFIEAFANVYLAAAQAIADQIEGNTPPDEGYDFPDATDGIAGLAFIETAVKSSASDQKWLKFPEI